MKPRALNPIEVVGQLSRLEGWRLQGDGAEVGITKTFSFASYSEVMSFVNAVAFMAQSMNHHPELVVHPSRCVVFWRTHDVQGLSQLDFEAAQRVETWLKSAHATTAA